MRIYEHTHHTHIYNADPRGEAIKEQRFERSWKKFDLKVGSFFFTIRTPFHFGSPRQTGFLDPTKSPSSRINMPPNLMLP